MLISFILLPYSLPLHTFLILLLFPPMLPWVLSDMCPFPPSFPPSFIASLFPSAIPFLVFLIVEFLQHFLILFYTSFLLSFPCVCPYILPNLLFPAVSFYTSFMYVTFLSFMHHFCFLLSLFTSLFTSSFPSVLVVSFHALLIPPSLFLHPFIAHDFLT